MVTQSCILAWRIPWTTVHRESDMTERLSLFTFQTGLLDLTLLCGWSVFPLALLLLSSLGTLSSGSSQATSSRHPQQGAHTSVTNLTPPRDAHPGLTRQKQRTRLGDVCILTPSPLPSHPWLRARQSLHIIKCIFKIIYKHKMLSNNDMLPRCRVNTQLGTGRQGLESWPCYSEAM